MVYVIAEPCIGVKDKSCIAVCPMDYIYATDIDKMLCIQPDECIDYGASAPGYPVSAIFPVAKVPSKWQAYI